MRIISKFNDYYDSAMALGQDQSVIYLRNAIEFKHKENNIPKLVSEIASLFKKKDDTRRFWSPRNLVNDFSNKDASFAFKEFWILFCGKIYPGIRVTKTFKCVFGTEVSNFYSSEALINYLVSAGKDVDKKEFKWDKNRSLRKDIESYYTPNRPDKNWLIANKVTCIYFDHTDLIVNPRLVTYDFYKVFDSHSAYQELDMWVSGTLAYPQNIMLEVEDKYRIDQHGFDPKYGFRTKPSK